MKNQEHLDEIDLRLLRSLQADARLSTAELGEQLALSQSPTWRRLKRLEQLGVITGYQAVIDREQLGYSVLAMVTVGVDSHSEKSARAFEQAVSLMPEIVWCHGMSGAEDFVLLVVARDLKHFSDLLLGKLRTLPAVKSLRSSFSLKAVKDDVALKLPI
ncbi:MAG: Lrp/AsnC family transcriptional regulator [Brachymonas sp.]|nr:Lrp/AsnC family transcriptional regulator [Brachymonas sp.]NJS36961.1 Lrp/AsnC family transcriptional regulator [Brachymonas sp.]